MAYYDGVTLKKKIARGPLKIDEAVDFAIQIVQGLVKAQNAGILQQQR